MNPDELPTGTHLFRSRSDDGQEFKIRRLQDLLPKADKDDIITLFLALQRQCFTLGTMATNLLKMRPNPRPITPPDQSKSGTSSETKSWIITCNAIKYICRAGKKPDNTAAKDLAKLSTTYKMSFNN